MKIKEKIYDKYGNELHFEDLDDLLLNNELVYNKNGDEVFFDKEGNAQVLSKGFIDIPGSTHVTFCPYCYACQNEFFDATMVKHQCKIYGDLPRNILFDHNQSCGDFQIDVNSCDYEIVKRQLQ